MFTSFSYKTSFTTVIRCRTTWMSLSINKSIVHDETFMKIRRSTSAERMVRLSFGGKQKLMWTHLLMCKRKDPDSHKLQRKINNASKRVSKRPETHSRIPNIFVQRLKTEFRWMSLLCYLKPTFVFCNAYNNFAVKLKRIFYTQEHFALHCSSTENCYRKKSNSANLS
jgi:hypothetical protein